MVIVVPDAEPLLDQVPDHRAGPDARLIASLHRSEFDDDRQRLALLVGQLWRRAFRDRSPESIDVFDVVPLQPTIDRAAGYAAFGGDVGHLPSCDVRANRTAATPLAEVVLELRFDDEVVELLKLHATAA